MSTVVSEADVKLDAKHRVTVRKPPSVHYRMRSYEDGTIVLEPMNLVSKKTLAEMEQAISQVKKGTPGTPVDMKQVQALITEDDV